MQLQRHALSQVNCALTIFHLLLDCVGPKATSTAVNTPVSLLKTLPRRRDNYLVIGHVNVLDVSRNRLSGYTRGDA